MPNGRRVRTLAVLAVAALLVTTSLDGAIARRRNRVVLHDCGDPFLGEAPDGFTVDLLLDKGLYRKGEPVQLTLQVTNTTAQGFAHFVGLPDAVFAVFKEEKLIWSSSWGQAFPAIALEEVFEPGERKTATATWQQDLCRTDDEGVAGDPAFAPGPPRAGSYTAQASWRGVWASDAVPFTIVR